MTHMASTEVEKKGRKEETCQFQEEVEVGEKVIIKEGGRRRGF